MATDSLLKWSYATAVVVGVLTIPSIVRLFIDLWWRAKSAKHDGLVVYEDKDGIATEESMAEFETSNQKPLMLVFIIALLGLSVSFAVAVFGTVRRQDAFTKLCLLQLWLLFAAWVRNSIISWILMLT